MAYQGKFSQPRNTEENIRLKAEARKQEAAAKQAAPVKKAEPEKAPVKKAPVAKAVPQPEAAPAEKPRVTQAPAPVRKPEANQELKQEAAPVEGAKIRNETAPVKKAPKKTDAPKKSGKKKKKKVKKANRNVTIVFYTLYFMMIAAFLGGMFFLNNWLNNFLVNYQASQPTTRCEEIFQQHFADPDWATLYAQAGLSDTAFEGSDAFAAYMEAKVGANELTYVETSAGLSGGHKYLLKLADETRIVLRNGLKLIGVEAPEKM